MLFVLVLRVNEKVKAVGLAAGVLALGNERFASTTASYIATEELIAASGARPTSFPLGRQKIQNLYQASPAQAAGLPRSHSRLSTQDDRTGSTDPRSNARSVHVGREHRIQLSSTFD